MPERSPARTSTPEAAFMIASPCYSTTEASGAGLLPGWIAPRARRGVGPPPRRPPRALGLATGGGFAGKERVTLDVPGTYRFFLMGEWQGHLGYMPGLPPDGGEVYVVEKDRPADAPRLRLNLPVQSTFTPTAGLTITGTSTAKVVRFAALLHRDTPTYDTVYIPTGRSEIRDVVHLTFSSQELAPDGRTCHSFTRVILRGNQVLYLRD